MVKGFGNMMKQMQKLQQEMERIQEELANKTVEGTTGGGMVKVIANGKQEILAADKYGAVKVFSPDGAPLAGSYSELGDVEFAVGDPNGDGKLDLVNGSSTGALRCTEALGAEEWRFDNFGYAACDVEIATLAGAERVVIASETGYVYALDGQGKVVNQLFIGPAVRRLAFWPADVPEKQIVAAGCDGGDVYLLTPDLRPISRAALGAGVTAMTAMNEAFVVGLADGRVALVSSR
jgi:outer membrane protein assembly factor BamB